MKVKNDIGRRLKAERRRQGITAKEMAEYLWGSEEQIQNLYNLEGGEVKRISIDMVYRICRILEVTPNWIFYGTE
jgi:transcriptional regulator with XRE-family HTH domain